MPMLTQILASVFLLALCIFFHELGHFLIGKWVGVQPKIFSIGYGKGFLFKKVGRTLYQLTAIPLGGYVQFYGDDITKEKTRLRKGDFFSVGPWRRIALAVGGPFFSVLLGVIVFFFLYSFGFGNITNQIRVVEGDYPAREAGLRDSDRIVSVNGRKTSGFETLNYLIGFADDAKIHLEIERDGKTLEKTVTAKRPQPDLPYQIGIQPMGQTFLMVQTNADLGKSSLKAEDILLTADGQKIDNIDQLHNIVDANIGKEIPLAVERKIGGVFGSSRKEVSITATVKEMESFTLTNLTDTQTKTLLPEKTFTSFDNKFEKIFIDGKNYSSWEELKKAMMAKESPEHKIFLAIEAVEVQAQVNFQTRGILGISFVQIIQPQNAPAPHGVLAIIDRSLNQTWFTAESTMVGLWYIITGKLSFNKSMAGPVKIISFAAQSVEKGWQHYWYLLANITIILGVMNLLPIPVLDGGHVVFYLIEAFYKPLKPATIAASVRVGMVFLLTFGIYVIGHDIWDVFLKNFFG